MERKKMMYSEQQRVNRILTLTKFKQQRESEIDYEKKLLNIKEYDICKQITKQFIDKQFPRISFIYGGYSSIHTICEEYQISIMNHEKEFCRFCGKNTYSNSKVKLEEKNKVNESDIFSTFISNFVSLFKSEKTQGKVDQMETQPIQNSQSQILKPVDTEKILQYQPNKSKKHHSMTHMTENEKTFSISSKNSKDIYFNDEKVSLMKEKVIKFENIEKILTDLSVVSFKVKNLKFKDEEDYQNKDILISVSLREQTIFIILVTENENKVLELIEIGSIIDAFPKKGNKLVVNVKYISLYQPKSISIEFLSDLDSKSFTSLLKKNLIGSG